MIENEWKTDAKLEPKPIKIMKNEVPKNDAKKEAHARTWKVGGCGGRPIL